MLPTNFTDFMTGEKCVLLNSKMKIKAVIHLDPIKIWYWKLEINDPEIQFHLQIKVNCCVNKPLQEEKRKPRPQSIHAYSSNFKATYKDMILHSIKIWLWKLKVKAITYRSCKLPIRITQRPKPSQFHWPRNSISLINRINCCSNKITRKQRPRSLHAYNS